MIFPSKDGSLLAIALAMLCIFLPSLHAAEFSPQNACEYRGYAPGSVNNVKSSNAKKPEAFQTSMLQTGLDYFMKGSGVSAATLGVIDAVGDIMKAAPQMTAAIGILSVGMGFLSDTPSPQDVVDKAYESVQFLSNEVNVMMAQMQDYVDARDLNIEKSIMVNHFHEMFNKWFGCGKESSLEASKTCQKDAVDAMNNKRVHFQRHHDLFNAKINDHITGARKAKYDPNFPYRKSTGWWQWMDEHCNVDEPAKYPMTNFYCLTHYQVKQLEIGIIPFRDFASMHLLALETLVATYKARKGRDKIACANYRRYLKEMINSGKSYADYAEWAYQWTYIRQYEENDFLGMKSRWLGSSATAFRGGYLGTRECSENKCTMQCSQVYTENICTATGGDKVTLTEELSKKCGAYVAEVKAQLNDFWNNKVLEVSKLWKTYSEEAAKRLDTERCRT